MDNTSQNDPYKAILMGSNAPSSSLDPYKGILEKNSPTPQSILKAKEYVGSQDYNGMCQQFVGDITGNKTKGGSAVEAWNNNLDKAVPNTEGMKSGDMVYLIGNSPDAPGQSFNFGHTGIYEGNGMFISATNNGVKEENLDKWAKENNQKVLGYIPNK